MTTMTKFLPVKSRPRKFFTENEPNALPIRQMNKTSKKQHRTNKS